MFVRDAWTGNLMPGNMTWLNGVAGASESIVSDASVSSDPLFNQIRALSHQMAPLQQSVNSIISSVSNADAPAVNMDLLASQVVTLAGLHAQFNQLVAQWKGQNPYAGDLQLATDYTAFLSAWARSVLDAIPGVIAAVPNAVVDGLGKIASNTGSVVFGALMPWLAVGGLVLFAVTQAEKTRTYRKVVA